MSNFQLSRDPNNCPEIGIALVLLLSIVSADAASVVVCYGVFIMPIYPLPTGWSGLVFPLFTVNPCIHYCESRDWISSNPWLRGSSSYASPSVIFLIKGQCMNSLNLNLSCYSPLERMLHRLIPTLNREQRKTLFVSGPHLYVTSSLASHNDRFSQMKRQTRYKEYWFRVYLFARKELVPHAPTLFLNSYGCARGAWCVRVQRYETRRRWWRVRDSLSQKDCYRFKLHNNFAA